MLKKTKIKKKYYEKPCSHFWVTWKVQGKKNIKENIDGYVVIFFLLISLKMNEENKKKKGREKLFCTIFI